VVVGELLAERRGVNLDFVVEQVEEPARIPSSVHAAYKLDVLLRHRPRSIPPKRAAFHAKQRSCNHPSKRRKERHLVPNREPKCPDVALSGEAQDSRRAQIGSQKRASGGSQFNEQEVERGLVALALFNGNSRRAAKALKGQGLSVGATTLRRWKDDLHPEKYRKLQQDTLPEIRERAAEMHTDLAEQEVRLSGRLVQDLGQRLERGEELPIRDVPGAIRNLDTGAGINRDKASGLRGEPNVRVEKQLDVGAILRELDGMGFPVPKYMLDAIDVEVIEEEPEQEAA
jgi:hypothetical protein